MKRSWRNPRWSKKKYVEANDSENTMTSNLWDAAKAVLRGKFIVIQSSQEIKKSQIKKLIIHLKQPEKEQTKYKVNRTK